MKDQNGFRKVILILGFQSTVLYNLKTFKLGIVQMSIIRAVKDQHIIYFSVEF